MTDGVMFCPSRLAITSGRPYALRYATAELVVPRSIPTKVGMGFGIPWSVAQGDCPGFDSGVLSRFGSQRLLRQACDRSAGRTTPRLLLT